MRKTITYLHPVWRRILFPFYSIYETVFVGILVVSIVPWVFVFNIEDKLPIVVLGYIGAVVVAFGSSPAILVDSTLRQEAVERLLEKGGFVRSGGRWLPPLPGFLRWSHNFIEPCEMDGGIEIKGPHNLLRFIDRELAPDQKAPDDGDSALA